MACQWPGGLFVPKPTRDVACHHSYSVRPASTVHGRPPTSAGVCGDCYSVGYSPAKQDCSADIPRPGRAAPAAGDYVPVVQPVGSGVMVWPVGSPCADRPLIRPGITQVRRATCARSVLSPVAAVSRWLLLLVSSLLSAQPKSPGRMPIRAAVRGSRLGIRARAGQETWSDSHSSTGVSVNGYDAPRRRTCGLSMPSQKR